MSSNKNDTPTGDSAEITSSRTGDAPRLSVAELEALANEYDGLADTYAHTINEEGDSDDTMAVRMDMAAFRLRQLIKAKALIEKCKPRIEAAWMALGGLEMKEGKHDEVLPLIAALDTWLQNWKDDA